MAQRSLVKLSAFNAVSLALGLAFLYLPILILVIYSFNASRLVTVWGGWSGRGADHRRASHGGLTPAVGTTTEALFAAPLFRGRESGMEDHMSDPNMHCNFISYDVQYLITEV